MVGWILARASSWYVLFIVGESCTLGQLDDVGWCSAMPKMVISQFVVFYHAPKWLFFLGGAHVWTDGGRPTWVPPAVPSAWIFAMSWRENALRSGWKCPWAPRPDRKLLQEPWGTFYLILWGLFSWWHSMSTHANHGEELREYTWVWSLLVDVVMISFHLFIHLLLRTRRHAYRNIMHAHIYLPW